MADKELNIKLNFASQAAQGFATAAQRASRFKVAAQKAAVAFNKVGLEVLKSNTRLGATARGMVRVGLAARKMTSGFRRISARVKKFIAEMKTAEGRARAFRSVVSRLGGFLRGALTVGLTAAIGGVFALSGAFSAMRDAMEGSGGAGPALADVSDQAGDAASGLSDAADQGEAAANKIKGVFGAFGAVATGFVQKQGKLGEETANVMDTAVASAGAASAALDEATDSLGGATQATTRFGRATDRISAAFARAKQVILQAIAKAITPALEKFADLLESPAFKEFVDLIAKDLAKAARAVGRWFVTKVIPAIKDFMKAVKNAGGPIEFIKGKFQEWKTTAKTVLAIIVGAVLIASNKVRDFFGRAINTVKLGFTLLKLAIVRILMEASTSAQNILTGLGEIVKGVFNNIIAAIETAINAAIAVINPFISLFNALAEATGGRRLEALNKIELPRLQAGGIVNRPTAAIVGDAPSPEVISPLDDLVDILRDLGIGGGLVINVAVPVGTTDPQGFGNSVGNTIAVAIRRQGQRIPAI